MENLLILILALIGLAITIYLYSSHLAKKPVICPIDGHGCNEVLQSKWSRLFGVKNELLGLIYYISLIAAILLIERFKFITPLVKVACTGSILMSLFLLFIQIKVLKKYCFWCILSAIVNLISFALIIKL